MAIASLLSRKWFANVALVAVSVLLVVGLSELATRLVWTEDTHFLYQVLPGGTHLMPNTEAVYKSTEFEFTVRANRFGRRDADWSPETMADPSGIIFVGDSFVFGYGVNDEDSVPTALEREFLGQGATREVFNFGVGGGLPEYADRTREAIQQGIQAKTVLIGIFLGNDLTEAPIYSQGKKAESWNLRLPTLNDSALYRFTKSRVSGSPLLTGWIFRAGRAFGVDLYASNTGYIFLREWTSEQEKVFYSLLDRASDIEKIAREAGRDVTYVIFPNKVQVENAADLTSDVYDAALPDARILDFCKEKGLSCLDLLPVLRNTYTSNSQPLFFPIDRHMNKQGNLIAARAIREYLASLVQNVAL